ncbi:MAG: hypothetical protein R3240_03275 [Gammaproteobacteria bacterium]|nr:hypothetical protein [Gammaproteobacteria bacterium]
MHMKTLYISYLSLLPALAIGKFGPLVELISMAHQDILLSPYFLFPIYLVIAIYVMGNIFHITQYTDEFLPLQLSLLNFVVAGIGMWIYPQLVFGAAALLIFSAYWCSESVEQYFPKFRR